MATRVVCGGHAGSKRARSTPGSGGPARLLPGGPFSFWYLPSALAKERYIDLALSARSRTRLPASSTAMTAAFGRSSSTSQGAAPKSC
jgi:hypothetical protein